LKRFLQKLDVKRFDFFNILEIIDESKLIFKLKFSSRVKIHSMFHVFLLESYHVNVIVDKNQLVSSLLKINDHEEWKIEEILDSKIKRNKLSYFVDWIEYFVDECFWKLISYLVNVINVVSRYHIRYSLRFSFKNFKSINHRRLLISQKLDREEKSTVMNVNARIKFLKYESSL